MCLHIMLIKYDVYICIYTYIYRAYICVSTSDGCIVVGGQVRGCVWKRMWMCAKICVYLPNTWLYVCLCVYVHVCDCECECLFRCVYILCSFLIVYIYIVYIYVRIYVCIYVYKYVCMNDSECAYICYIYLCTFV